VYPIHIVYKHFYGNTQDHNKVKDMKKIVVLLLVIGLLLGGTLPVVHDVCDQEFENVNFSGTFTDINGGISPNGGGGSGGGPAPG
jgi:hypothetical protein